MVRENEAHFQPATVGLMPPQTAPVVAIVGPSAVGKTRLALELSPHLPIEVISADSRQVYRHLDVGTAKPGLEERRAVPHHLIDVVDPSETFSVHAFLAEATQALAEIASRGNLAVIVGGTGHYVSTLVHGLSFPAVAPNPALRKQIEAELTSSGIDALVQEVTRVNQQAAERLDKSNPRRVVRAIEIVRTLGTYPSVSSAPNFPCLVLGLSCDRTVLYTRADHRVVEQIENGLIEETRNVLDMGYSPDSPGLRGLAYDQMVGYLLKNQPLSQSTQEYIWATHDLIRRQLTWFRKESDVVWLDTEEPDVVHQALGHIKPFLQEATQGVG
jgi:tRNA dimethylallyltransferase